VGNSILSVNASKRTNTKAINARITDFLRAILIQEVFSSLLEMFSDFLEASFTVAVTVVIVMAKLSAKDLGISAPISEWFHISATEANSGTSPLPLSAKYTIIKFTSPAIIALVIARLVAKERKLFSDIVLSILTGNDSDRITSPCSDLYPATLDP